MSRGTDGGMNMGNMQRPSLRVAVAAALLQVNISTIYKMVRGGVLEAHHIGKRGVRVFADSVREYQEGQKIVTTKTGEQPNLTSPKRGKWQNFAHREALDLLRQNGVI